MPWIVLWIIGLHILYVHHMKASKNHRSHIDHFHKPLSNRPTQRVQKIIDQLSVFIDHTLSLILSQKRKHIHNLKLCAGSSRYQIFYAQLSSSINKSKFFIQLLSLFILNPHKFIFAFLIYFLRAITYIRYLLYDLALIQ